MYRTSTLENQEESREVKNTDCNQYKKNNHPGCNPGDYERNQIKNEKPASNSRRSGYYQIIPFSS